MEMLLNEHNILKGNLIVQDGEYLIVNNDHRVIARPQEIGYIAYRKQHRNFHTENSKTTEYDLELATAPHLKHYAERNNGELHIYADENNMPLIYKDKIVIV
jgi:hypothetical protein